MVLPLHSSWTPHRRPIWEERASTGNDRVCPVQKLRIPPDLLLTLKLLFCCWLRRGLPLSKISVRILSSSSLHTLSLLDIKWKANDSQNGILIYQTSVCLGQHLLNTSFSSTARMVFLEVWIFSIIHYFLLRMLRSGCHVLILLVHMLRSRSDHIAAVSIFGEWEI